MITLSFGIPALDYPLIFSFVTALGLVLLLLSCLIGACIIAASFLVFLVYIICECLSWPIFERFVSDLLKRGIRRARLVTYQAIIPNYLQSLDMIEEFSESIEERIELRKQALEKLLPPVVYGGGRHRQLGPGRSGDCAICLDDYAVGDSCRVFPVCKHMFHLSCIDNWLDMHLTCPVCRKSI